MSRAPRTTPDRLAKARIRSFVEAKILDASSGRIHDLHGARKAEVIGAMAGTIAEIGPGTGANMRYYPPGVKVIAIEPNPNMHGPLRDRAAEYGVDLEIRTVQGERVDIVDAGVDHVVGTLVLCGVDDPASVVAEVKRILRPGGTYFFLEHIGAEPGTNLRRLQELVFRPHRWMGNGCETTRDTTSVIDAAGFSSLDHAVLDAGPAGLYTRIQLVGTAVR